MLAKDVRSVNVPTFPELSVAQMIVKAQSDQRIVDHFPDNTKKKQPNKEFVWHVIAHF